MEKPQVLFLLGVYVLFLFPILKDGLMVQVEGTKDGSEAWEYVDVRQPNRRSMMNAEGTKDGSEKWGYVEVRPNAHVFWWYYKSPQRTQNSSHPWPIILWLQGGPGASGVGFGNFQLIGPLDTYLKPRSSTWLQKADLLFVDNPVGTGFSYVEKKSLLVKTDEEAAADLTTLLIEVFNKNKHLQKCPLYIVGESYGGRYAITLGLSALKSINAGKLKAKLGGIALGDAWISPEDYVFSWGPLLKDVSRLDDNGLVAANRVANKIKHQLMADKTADALDSWDELQDVIYIYSDGVDVYNFMLDLSMDPLATTTSAESSQQTSSSSSSSMKRYSTYLSSLNGDDDNLTRLMNDEIREKLKIIPPNITWVIGSGDVFEQTKNDFMRPRIKEVDTLLSYGIDINIYNGQLDVICSTRGTEAWVQKLKWSGLRNFLRTNRSTIYCGDDITKKVFAKSHRNLHFYWVLGAGHYVPADQPCVTLNMIANIIQSPNVSKK